VRDSKYRISEGEREKEKETVIEREKERERETCREGGEIERRRGI
jgi:hypothetical protein